MRDSFEPLWMRTLRAEARERFQEMAWPTPAQEEWRRTDVSRLGIASFTPVEAAPSRPPREGNPGAAAGSIRFEEGACIEVALAREWRDQGVRLLPLDYALEEFEAPLHQVYQEGLQEADNRILVWHYASLGHGALLWVPAGLEIQAPFFIDFQEHGNATMSAPHVVVLLGTGARASVVQRISAAQTADAMLCNAMVDLRVGDAAGLRYCEVQELGARDLYFRHARASVARDGSLRHFDAELGARLAKTRTECALSGPGAEAFLDGMYFCGANQHMDLRTVQNHVSPKATSRAFYKGAVAGGGRTVFQGLINVAPGASGTDAFLTNRNLILGEAARSDSIPTLKIGNNDVQCSHGSTSGRLSAEELFYLESRGLSPADAREMLVVGYFEELLGPVPERIREDTLSSIRERLRRAA